MCSHNLRTTLTMHLFTSPSVERMVSPTLEDAIKYVHVHIVHMICSHAYRAPSFGSQGKYERTHRDMYVDLASHKFGFGPSATLASSPDVNTDLEANTDV